VFPLLLFIALFLISFAQTEHAMLQKFRNHGRIETSRTVCHDNCNQELYADTIQVLKSSKHYNKIIAISPIAGFVSNCVNDSIKPSYYYVSVIKMANLK
jgi:hypothetical protein